MAITPCYYSSDHGFESDFPPRAGRNRAKGIQDPTRSALHPAWGWDACNTLLPTPWVGWAALSRHISLRSEHCNHSSPGHLNSFHGFDPRHKYPLEAGTPAPPCYTSRQKYRTGALSPHTCYLRTPLSLHHHPLQSVPSHLEPTVV